MKRCSCQNQREENPVSTTAMWVGASILTALGTALIIEALRQPKDTGYTYEPPITYNT